MTFEVHMWPSLGPGQMCSERIRSWGESKVACWNRRPSNTFFSFYFLLIVSLVSIFNRLLITCLLEESVFLSSLLFFNYLPYIFIPPPCSFPSVPHAWPSTHTHTSMLAYTILQVPPQHSKVSFAYFHRPQVSLWPKSSRRLTFTTAFPFTSQIGLFLLNLWYKTRYLPKLTPLHPLYVICFTLYSLSPK